MGGQKDLRKKKMNNIIVKVDKFWVARVPE